MSNVKLSDAELALACNADILLTKNKVINAVYGLFGQLCKYYAATIEAYFVPSEIIKATAKISKGENYLGLPWVMLDYPRHFEDENIFSVRTMFWWGNHFSIFIFLKGKFLNENIAQHFLELQHTGEFFLSVSEDPWQHHFEENNMVTIAALTIAETEAYIEQCGYLKLGTKIPIEKWESVEKFMNENFILYIKLALS